MAKFRWSKAKTDYLRRHAGRTLEELADHFRTDPEVVQKKLEELDVEPVRSTAIDAALEHYDEALGLLHKKQWKKAAAIFQRVTAEADDPHLADRARQNRAVCRQRLRAVDAADDPYLQAVVAKNQGDLDHALKLCKKHGKLDKDERYAYLAASIRALAEDEKKALEYLQAAIRLEPRNRVHAFHDPDFESLRGTEGFRNLTADSSS